MDPKISTNLETNISLKGEVIEILKKDGKAHARISLSPGFITVPLLDSSSALLNDLIIISGKLTVTNVVAESNKEDLPNIQFLKN